MKNSPAMCPAERSFDEPSAARRRLLADIVRVARADAGLFYAQAREGAGLRTLPNFEAIDPGGALGIAAANMNAFLRENPGSTVDPLRVRPVETQQFVEATTLFGSWPKFVERPMSQWVLARTGLADQIRLLAFSGDRYLGWIGAFRRIDAPRFSAAERRALAALVPRCVDILAAADHQERSIHEASSPAYVVTSADGAVEHASRGAHAWLGSPSFREAVTAAIHAHHESAPTTFSTYIRHAAARITRLEGAGGGRFLVSLEPAPEIRRPASASLSPTQERVARLLADGLTRKEVADLMGLGEETVRSHAREAYRRLGVSDRVELVRVLAGAPSEP